MKDARLLKALCVLVLIVCSEYQNNYGQSEPPQDYRKTPIDGPVLGGEEAISKMYIEEGFELNLFAAEPHVINPVVMRFDERGRLWVVEMVGYMNNMKGTKELDEIGRISILEDENGDGKMDRAKVFLDKLVEPRALAFHKNGLLWADTKSLYFTTIVNAEEAGKTVVVDEKYSSGHSVEHKPNALLRAIDNWYYNAKSHKRYRVVDGQWKIENVEFRNQYGLSMDNHGRLYHGQQNTFLRADVFPPGFFLRNPRLNVRVNGLATKNNVIQENCFSVKVNEQAVFTVRPNNDMRDGYLESPHTDIRKDGYAFRSTSAVSHFFYRDDYFPKHMNAFVPDPALHILKVITVERKEGIPFGKNTFPNRELIASPDTRFRPIDVQSAPDGTIYLADLYHGVLQHKVFLSAHLKKFVKTHKLEAPLGLGRVYRLTVKGKKPNPWKPFINPSVERLVNALASKNPWERDHAQRLLVDGKHTGVEGELDQLLQSKSSTLGKIHALWTLEGRGTLKESHVLDALNSKQLSLVMHAARLSWQLENSPALLKALVKAVSAEFHESIYYVTQRLANFKEQEAQQKVTQLYLKWGDKPYFKKVILSGSATHLDDWIAQIPEATKKKEIEDLLQTLKVKRKAPKTKLSGKALASFKRGKQVYAKFCFACHGLDGKGMKKMGPPLEKSDWVTGDSKVIAKIILKGMQGEITVRGEKFKPEIPMTPFEALMKDQEVADVMTYIRNEWGNKASAIDTFFVKKVRQEIKNVKMFYTQSDFRK